MKYITHDPVKITEWERLFRELETAWHIHCEYSQIDSKHFEFRAKALHKLNKELAFRDYKKIQEKIDLFIKNYELEE